MSKRKTIAREYDNGRGLYQVQGYDVTLSSGIRCIVSCVNQQWKVSEYNTGLAMARDCKTMSGAIDTAECKIAAAGIERTRRVIDNSPVLVARDIDVVEYTKGKKSKPKKNKGDVITEVWASRFGDVPYGVADALHSLFKRTGYLPKSKPTDDLKFALWAGLLVQCNHYKVTESVVGRLMRCGEEHKDIFTTVSELPIPRDLGVSLDKDREQLETMGAW